LFFSFSIISSSLLDFKSLLFISIFYSYGIINFLILTGVSVIVLFFLSLELFYKSLSLLEFKIVFNPDPEIFFKPSPLNPLLLLTLLALLNFEIGEMHPS